MYEENGNKSKSGEYTDEECFIIAFSHTIIEPHTMVIEIFDASITGSTMLTLFETVTIAVVTKHDFLIIRLKFNGTI